MRTNEQQAGHEEIRDAQCDRNHTSITQLAETAGVLPTKKTLRRAQVGGGRKLSISIDLTTEAMLRTLLAVRTRSLLYCASSTFDTSETSQEKSDTKK